MKKSYLVPLLGLLWAVSVLLMYFISHKPFDPAAALAIFQLAWRMLVPILLLAAAGGLGLRLFHPQEVHPLARLALQAGLGLGLLALGVLLVGGTLGLPGWLPWTVLALLLLLLRRSIRAWLAQLGSLGELWRESGRFERWTAGLCAALLIGPLLVALAPPLRFDALVSHLLLPQTYLQAGRISYLPEQVMSGMPQNMEMLYTWAMALGGAQAAAALGWAIGGLTLVGLLGFLRQRLDARAAWVGTASLLAGYTLVMLFGWAYMDSLPFLLGLGVLICLDGWQQQGGLRWAAAAGALAGLALGSKYTAGVIAVSGALVLLWGILRRRAKGWQSLLVFGLAALLAVAPWLVKNWITTGNPFYPFFFPAGQMTAVRLEVYQSVPPYGNWLDFFLLPLRATSLGIDSAEGYMFAPGALLLALGGLFWLAWRELPEDRRPFLQTAALVSISGLLTWAVANRWSGNLIQTRYYISLFPAFAALAALGDYGLTRRSLPGVRLSRLVNVVILLALGLNLVETGLATLRINPLPVLAGLKDEQTYLADNLGWYQPAMQAIQKLPGGSRVLLLYEARGYYCLPRCEADEILDRWKVTRAEGLDAAAIRQQWINEGYTHVLFYKSGAEFLVENKDPHHPPEDLQSLRNFLTTLPAPVDFGGIYQLYSLVE